MAPAEAPSQRQGPGNGDACTAPTKFLRQRFDEDRESPCEGGLV